MYEVFAIMKSEIGLQVSQDLSTSGVGALNQNDIHIEIKE
jgi:hypothetical protein